MQEAILFKILTCQPTWYIREVYSGLPERPEIVRLILPIIKPEVDVIRNMTDRPKTIKLISMTDPIYGVTVIL